ncbi:hypothetical protein J2S13_000806 [Oikeobacillus pervagus]|uniref:Uncharacterized protein n=1 Tax=Oikeobacillus pervagus TaxID=1325931 RepID=A0AAJ1WI94_9BACI|nr:hypothetical protein [Oikeobacillus pervagus]MDQ0214410.1 hypothetical protein [Oikeobacillus pervagus]
MLEAYRQVWNNRKLPATESLDEDVLRMAIERELLDENSHPRVRRTKEEKFFFAIQRLCQSDLSEHEKISLIELHVQIMEKLKG